MWSEVSLVAEHSNQWVLLHWRSARSPLLKRAIARRTSRLRCRDYPVGLSVQIVIVSENRCALNVPSVARTVTELRSLRSLEMQDLSKLGGLSRWDEQPVSGCCLSLSDRINGKDEQIELLLDQQKPRKALSDSRKRGVVLSPINRFFQ